MAAAVAADVDEQAVAVDLVQEGAVELGVAVRPHVRDVEVADAAVGLRVDARAVGLDPVAVAQRRLVGERRDRRSAPRAAVLAAHGEHHRLVGLVDQPLDGRLTGRHRLAVDREQMVAGADVDAGRLSGERAFGSHESPAGCGARPRRAPRRPTRVDAEVALVPRRARRYSPPSS